MHETTNSLWEYMYFFLDSTCSLLRLFLHLNNLKNMTTLSLKTEELLGTNTNEGRILFSGSSQGESSVMRVRLKGRKNPITNMH